MLNRRKCLVRVLLPLLVTGVLIAGVIVVRRDHDGAQSGRSGIVVTSKGDDVANDGRCTFREAIIAANTDHRTSQADGECTAGRGRDHITFAIDGPADFRTGGANGYTIGLRANLPEVTHPVVIDGYSQPGAEPNTTPAPGPLDGRLLIEIDGSHAPEGTGLALSADHVHVSGLVLNSIAGTAIAVGGDNSILTGNYIGTDPTGRRAKPHGADHNGINGDTEPGSTGLRIGGLLASERNLISGNTGAGITPNTDDNDWVIQGNYIGVDSTGMKALPNSSAEGPGGLSLDNSNGHKVGGRETTAVNVISGNLNAGIAPDNTVGIEIRGNLIGVGRDGKTSVGNQGAGITFSSCKDPIIADNVVENSVRGGVYFGDCGGVRIEDNTIASSGFAGLILARVTDARIYRNDITGSTMFAGRGGYGIVMDGVSDVVLGARLRGNSVYENAGADVLVGSVATPGDLDRLVAVAGNCIGLEPVRDRPCFGKDEVDVQAAATEVRLDP
jgi:CSLREA domain-containing protein